MENYTVTDKITIAASSDKVWEVLTNPEFIKHWDNIPDTYKGGKLTVGAELNWEGYSKMTVVELNEKQQLSLKLYLPRVDLAPEEYDVRYTYKLAESNGQTDLEFEIGDFGALPNPSEYYEATLEFVETAKEKIKELAEN